MLLVCCSLQPAIAEVIKLKDGAKITGSIVSLNNGIYVVESPSLGTVSIKKNQVVEIYTEEQSSQPGATSSMFESMQQTMLQDKAVMNMVMSLQNDPQVQAILADPEIMNAINSGDYSSLMNNQKLQQLMENNTVKSISNHVIHTK